MISAIVLILASWPARAATEIKFTDALARLRDRDLSVQAQLSEVRKAEAERLKGAAAFLPKIELRGSDTQSALGSPKRLQSGVLAGRINLFRSGADVAEWKAELAALRRERQRLEAVRLAAEMEHVSALVQFVQNELQLKVAENLARLNRDLQDVVTARYRRGLIPLQESQKAVIESNNSEAKFRDAQTRLESARARLEELSGEPMAIGPVWPWKSFLTPAAGETLTGRQLELGKTPAWRAAMEDVESLESMQRSRFREFLPSIDLDVGYGYQSYLTEKRPGWETTLTVSLPLFDLTKHSDYRLSREQARLARLNQEKVRRNLASAWDATRANLSRALQSAHQREESVRMAQSLYDDNQRRARAGRTSLNDIFVDQSRLADSETLAIDGWAQAHLAYVRACHDLGFMVDPDRFGCRPAAPQNETQSEFAK